MRPDQAAQQSLSRAGAGPAPSNLGQFRIVIVSGPGAGLFVYNGTPGAGNPPIASITNQTTDPYGNTVQPILAVGTAGQGETVITPTGVIELQNPSGDPALVLNPELSAELLYSPTEGPVFGVNHSAYSEVQGAMTNTVLGFRAYQFPTHSGTGNIPTTWPGSDAGPIPSGVTFTVQSFNAPFVGGGSSGDFDLAGIAAGTYDTELAAFFALVPPGQVCCFGHEYEIPAIDPGVTLPAYLAAMSHVLSVFRANQQTGAEIWQIFSSYSGCPLVADGNDPSTTWVVAGFDGYAIDGYNDSPADTLAVIYTDALAAVRNTVPDATLSVTETNSSTQADRPSWFSSLYEAIVADGGKCMMVFFSGTGNPATGQEWNASDSATIAELNTINDEPSGGSQLVMAIAAVAGTDPVLDESYPLGLQFTDTNGFQIQITDQDGAGVVRFLTNRPGEASAAIVASQVFSEGLSNERLDLSLYGPRETTPDNDGASISLVSSAKDGSSSAQGNLGILANLSGLVTQEGGWDVNGLYAYANADSNIYDTARGTLILGSPLTIDNTSGQTVLTVDVEPGIYAIDGFCECQQGGTAVAQSIGFGGPTAVTPTRIRYWFVEQGASQEFSEYSNIGSGLGNVSTPAYGIGDTFWFEFKGWVRFSASGAFGVTAASATGTETFTVENAFMNLRPCTRTVLE
jgi:hypothetical protein